jgi:hypothetical protein
LKALLSKGMTMNAKWLRPLLALAASALLLFELPAQVSTASINGTIRDTSGSLVPGALITLHSAATNIDKTTATNGFGDLPMAM